MHDNEDCLSSNYRILSELWEEIMRLLAFEAFLSFT